MQKHAFRITVLAILIALMSGTLKAQTVINRVRFGNVVEDATYIPSGPYAKQLVYLDAFNVMGVPNGAKSAAQPQVLFDTTRLSLLGGIAPRGLTYRPDTQQFVFTDNQDPYAVYFTDVHGNPTGTLSIQWPDGFEPANVEAIRWVNDATFPGKYLMAINDVDSVGHVAVIGPSGDVQALITPDYPDYITAIAYIAPNRLAFGVADEDAIRLADLSGTVLATVNSGYFDVEGLALVDNHTLLSMSHGSGKVVAYDTNLHRIPSLDRNYAYGFGITSLNGIAWDNDLLRFVSWGQNERLPAVNYGIYSLDALGFGVSRLTDLGTLPTPGLTHTSYMSREHQIAILTTPPRTLLFYSNNGLPVGSQPLGDPGYTAQAPITYIAPSDELALRYNNGAAIRIINAASWLDDRYIDLSATGVTNFVGMAYFNPQHPSGGEFLLFDPNTRLATIVNFNGEVLTTFDIVAKLGIFRPGAVTAIPLGNYCGLFATYDVNWNEIVEFSMPCQ